MNIKVKKLHPDAVVPQYMTAGSAGFDLYAVEDYIIAPGESAKLPLGLSFEIPEGYVLYICMRSGIGLKTKLRQSNGVGVIDSDYRGEVSMMFDNISEDDGVPEWMNIKGEKIFGGIHKTYDYGTYEIKKGDRICQGIISPIVQAIFTESDELSSTDRGAGGFGSTGS